MPRQRNRNTQKIVFSCPPYKFQPDVSLRKVNSFGFEDKYR
jgi:hypothetical protein